MPLSKQKSISDAVAQMTMFTRRVITKPRCTKQQSSSEGIRTAHEVIRNGIKNEARTAWCASLGTRES